VILTGTKSGRRACCRKNVVAPVKREKKKKRLGETPVTPGDKGQTKTGSVEGSSQRRRGKQKAASLLGGRTDRHLGKWVRKDQEKSARHKETNVRGRDEELVARKNRRRNRRPLRRKQNRECPDRDQMHRGHRRAVVTAGDGNDGVRCLRERVEAEDAA